MTRQTISRYRIIDKVAGGEMGIVDRAEQVTLGYSVALKFPPDGAARDPRTLRYVEREAQCACALNYPNVYTIHEIDDQLCMGANLMRTGFLMAVAAAVLLGGGVLVSATPPAGSGAITGKVTYTGTPPKMKPIDMSKEPTCAKQHATPVLEQNVATGPGNALEWVVVYISAGDKESAAASQAVKYDQKGCQYIPHVLPMQVAQELQIYNHDQTSHNIHPLAKINPEFNKSQPPGSPPIRTRYEKPEFIPVKCNIHNWMHGYFVVLNTSHYALTGEDGSFDIKALPPGKYTLTAWQEQYPAQSQEVTIGEGETKTVNFVFKVSK